MADSLLFDGTDDTIDFAVGGLGVFGPATICAIIKITAALAGGDIWTVMHAGTWQMTIGDDESPGLLLNTGFAFHANALTVDQWAFVGITKTSGTTVPDFHRYNGTTWTHNAGSGSIANSGTPTDFDISGPSAAEVVTGNILIAGYWNTVLSNGTIEGLTTMSAWQAANPVEAWRLDTMSAIQSFGTTGTADESSRTGTTLDTGDAPTWWSEGAVKAGAGVIGP